MVIRPQDGTAPEPEAIERGPRPLTSDELVRALSQLTTWTGTTDRITRELRVPLQQREIVLRHIADVEEELGHQASIEKRNDVDVITLRTPWVNAVTELDLQLARRIEATVQSRASH